VRRHVGAREKHGPPRDSKFALHPAELAGVCAVLRPLATATTSRSAPLPPADPPRAIPNCRAAAVVAIRNARKKQRQERERPKSQQGRRVRPATRGCRSHCARPCRVCVIFCRSASASHHHFLCPPVQAPLKEQREPEDTMSVWETIFGRAPDPTRRTSQYAHDGVRRAELASIRRVVEVIGCDEHEARARLQNFGWSVHETIAAFLRL
jgi:hypothetical protein